MSASDRSSPALLALDASAEPASAALLAADGETKVRIAPEGERAGAVLHVLVEGLLDDLRAAGGVLEAVVAVRGPGSFTGIRVALAAAGGLALAMGLPGIGVETTAALAWASGGQGLIAVLLDGGQGRLFTALHLREGEGLAREGPIQDLAPEEVRRLLSDRAPGLVLVRGRPPGWEELLAAGARPFSGPLAGAAAELASRGLASDPLEPLYARAPSIRAPS